MNFAGARAIVEEVLRPITVDGFLAAVGRKVVEARGAPDHPRAHLFGSDPRATVLGAYASHAKILDCHGPTSKAAPPAIDCVTSADTFEAVIRDLHDQDFTVRVPDVVPLAPELQLFARALELLLRQPVTASLFWSKSGAKAMVHHDKRDNLVVQLSGEKRWFVSTEPPALQNDWAHMLEAPAVLEQHKVLEMAPGDLLFIPRGTPHTVDSTTESLHLAILFTPLTLRDALIAAVDQMSDLDRSFREPAAPPATQADARLAPLAAEAFARLSAQCRLPAFFEEAMEHRAARFISSLPPLCKSAPPKGLTPNTEVMHTKLAICHVRNIITKIDFSLPGERILVHPGAEAALRLISESSRFFIRDLPGLEDTVRVALVERLVSSGLLEIAN